MNYSLAILLILVKITLVDVGTALLFAGPSIENGELSYKFHKFTDLRAGFFRIIGLLILVLSTYWLFSSNPDTKSNPTFQAVIGISTSIAILISLVIMIIGRKAIGWFNMTEIIDEEFLPPRVWGLISFIGFVILLIWLIY